MIDYYEILEVSPNASFEIIRAAHKILLHQYNVEHDSEDQSETQKLYYLNIAYDVLSDPDKRKAHDHELNKTKTALNESARAHNPDGLVGKSAPKISQATSNQVSNNPSILSQLNWNKWGWIISILAVVIVLISMVRPDPEKALQGQAAVKAKAEKEKNEIVIELKK